MKKLHKILKKINAKCSCKGQSSIEFVLVIPFLIIVIMIVSQLGYIVYIQNLLEHAARESARVLTTTNSDRLALERIKDISGNIKSDELDILISPHGSLNRNVGDIVMVNIRYAYPGIFNLIKLFTGKEIMIESRCSMRMECSSIM